MKITLEKLKKIVNEEIEQVVFENNIFVHLS